MHCQRKGEAGCRHCGHVVNISAVMLFSFVLSYYACLKLALKLLLNLCFFFCLLVVGKTSLITRFMYDSFDNTYQVNESLFVFSKASSLQAESIGLQWIIVYRPHS